MRRASDRGKLRLPFLIGNFHSKLVTLPFESPQGRPMKKNIGNHYENASSFVKPFCALTAKTKRFCMKRLVVHDPHNYWIRSPTRHN